MQKKAFKESQLYSWDAEPVDERPSEFMHSTGYATLSGYHSNLDITPRRAPARRSHFGLIGVLVFALIVIAVGGWAIVTFAPLLRH
jgi:hypothetical protein